MKAELSQEIQLMRGFMTDKEKKFDFLALTLAHLRQVFYFDFENFSAKSDIDRVNRGPL